MGGRKLDQFKLNSEKELRRKPSKKKRASEEAFL